METERSDASAALWKAIWGLADAWSETPAVQETAALLPRNRPISDRSVGATGVPAFLGHLDLVAGGIMHPLLYGSRVATLRQDPMVAGFGMPQFDEAELSAWLVNASRVEQAHQTTLGWLRSTLAGYPILRAPQLAPGSPLTTDNITARFIWPKHEFASGLNRLSSPPNVPELLGAQGSTRSALDEAVRNLAAQFRVSKPWETFGTASRDLDDAAKAQLRQARNELKMRLSDDQVDAHEENLALRRAEYRVHTTTDVVNSLAGPARTYADAFRDVHNFLTLTTCDVFGELALHGEPWPVSVTNLDVPHPGQPMIEFESPAPAGALLKPGQLLWIDSKLVTDAVRLERMSMSFDASEDSRDQFGALVLRGTAEGWPAPSATFDPPLD